MNQAHFHSDNMEDVRERLENTIEQSSVETMYDGEDCFITVTQKNYETMNESKWSFCVDFGTGKVQMLEPTEDEESFTSDNEVFRIIKNFLNGGMSREKRFGNKIGSSKKSIKSNANISELDNRLLTNKQRHLIHWLREKGVPFERMVVFGKFGSKNGKPIQVNDPNNFAGLNMCGIGIIDDTNTVTDFYDTSKLKDDLREQMVYGFSRHSTTNLDGLGTSEYFTLDKDNFLVEDKVTSSRKPIKSAKSVCVGFNTENGTLLWKRDDLYTLDGSTIRQTKRQDIADRWIEKYDLNTTDERRLNRFTQEGPSQIPWGLPLVEDKDQTNYNKKLASILPPHGYNR